MQKYIGFFSILIGIFTSMCTFSYVQNITTIMVLELIGIAISIFTLKKYKQKVVSYIGLALNGIPLAFVVLTFLFLA